MTKAIIVDIDGTLARNNSGRPWFGEGYEKRLHEDDVDPTVEKVLAALYDGRFMDEVLFVSGRTFSGWAETAEWIFKHTGHSPRTDSDVRLLMRADGDFRPDREVKLDLYNENIKGKYDVILALDDRPSIVDLWRSLDIPAWQVAEYR